MRRVLLLASVAILPRLALANPDVPAIEIANTQPQAQPPGLVGPPQAATDQKPKVVVPAGNPPPVNKLAPSAPLNGKEQAATIIAKRWVERNTRPVAGEDGVVRWPFGTSMPSVVCAPYQVCDIALAPGENVNEIHVGDKVQWSIMPATTGEGNERVTHLVVKPQDAGLVSSLLIYTDQRTYSIKLISTQKQFTPLTAFTYSDSEDKAWANYNRTPASAGTGGVRVALNDIDFNYRITGDKPSWYPLRAYSAGGKTYIDFPSSMQFATSPALMGVNDNGSFFRSPTEQMLRYRIAGDTYVVDTVLQTAKLISGVGGRQVEVDIERRSR
jgi:P-type conjugative transfer protein TrbG